MSEWYQLVDKARGLIDEIDKKLNEEKDRPEEPKKFVERLVKASEEYWHDTDVITPISRGEAEDLATEAKKAFLELVHEWQKTNKGYNELVTRISNL